jgi:hypothetical protein
MRTTLTRRILERIYGFAEPAAYAAEDATYECAYCGACAEDGAPPHAVDCPYWSVLPAFATPAAAHLVASALHLAE